MEPYKITKPFAGFNPGEITGLTKEQAERAIAADAAEPVEAVESKPKEQKPAADEAKGKK